MSSGIIVCGANGSGKSTLGKELAEVLHSKFMDIEDYSFSKENSDYMYCSPRSPNEVLRLLLDDMKNNERFVLSAVKGDLGNDIVSRYICAVLIKVPKAIRLQRVKNRSFEQFGERMLEGGDLFEKQKQFYDMVASRTDHDVDAWVDSLSCPVIRIDGTESIADNIKLIEKALVGFGLLMTE